MSKIGRKPIDVSKLQIEIKGLEVHYKGSKVSGVYKLPQELVARMDDKKLYLEPAKDLGFKKRDINRIWGLHRALLANELSGAVQDFEKNVEIKGLGYKAVKSGKKLVLSLGYSHKIDFDMPEGVTVDIDKTGQNLTFKSPNREMVGLVCSRLRDLRSPEPYKGTGIRLADEVVARKAGKAKGA